MTAKVRRIDFSPDEWLGGTRGLSFEEEGLYIRICALIYSQGGPITANRGALASLCSAQRRPVARILQQLIKLGKVIETAAGTITVRRCEAELSFAETRSKIAANIAAKRWKYHKTQNAAASGQAMPTHAEPKIRPNGHANQSLAETSAKKSRNFRPKAAETLTSGDANHQPSRKEELAPNEANSVLSAPCASPPLPSQGDGVAAPGASTREVRPAATSVFDDPELRAYGDAAFELCLEALRTKRSALTGHAEAAE